MQELSPITMKTSAEAAAVIRNGLNENSDQEHALDELLRGLSEQSSLAGDMRSLSPASVPSSAECPPSSNSFNFPGVIQPAAESPVSSPNSSEVESKPVVEPAVPEPLIEEEHLQQQQVVIVKEKVERKTCKRESRLSSNEEDIPDGVRLPQRKGGMHLWQFLYAMLRDLENRYAHLIEWTRNEKDLEFRLLEPEAIAVWWGHHKNKSNMSYDKLSRSLRYYYDKGIIRKINGERYVYRFCIDPEVMYKHIGNSENRPQLKPMPEAAKRAMSQFQPNGDYCSHAGNMTSPKLPLVAQDPDLLQGGRCHRKRSSPDQQQMAYQMSYPASAYYQDYRMYDHASYIPANSYQPESKRSNSAVELYTHSDPFAPYPGGSTIYYHQRDCISLPSSYGLAAPVEHSQSPSYLQYPPISNSPSEFIAMNGVPESSATPCIPPLTSVSSSMPPPLTSTSSEDSAMSTYSPNPPSLSPSVNEVFPMFSTSNGSAAVPTNTWSETGRESLDSTCITSPSLVEDNYLFSYIPAASSTGVATGSYQWATSELGGPEFDLILNNH